jgi:anti-sigma factor RsiW
MSNEADRLIDAALRDHARIAAPERLRRSLEQRYLAKRRRWVVPTASAFGGAVVAAALVLLLVRPSAPASFDIPVEAVGDHLRVLTGRGLGVEVSDMHQVKPWFAGKLEFVPPVTFLGNDDFPLAGGDLAVFGGHKSAAFVYHRRLHTISLFVFQASAIARSERTVQGFHVIAWDKDGFGFALVSDVNFDDLRALEQLVR